MLELRFGTKQQVGNEVKRRCMVRSAADRVMKTRLRNGTQHSTVLMAQVHAVCSHLGNNAVTTQW